MGFFSKADEAGVDAPPPAPDLEDFFRLPSYSEATATPLRYDIWRRGGMAGLKNLDLTITTEDPDNIAFHLCCPVSWSGRWTFSLRRGSKDGEEVAQLLRESMSTSLSFEVRMTKASPIPVRQTSMWQKEFKFSNGGEDFVWLRGTKWKDARVWSLSKASEASLPEDQRKVMARWLTTDWEWRKSGTLM
ncbi:hypothetical protein JCM6882_008578 [Rhodosporidiobolus microsporus]